MTDTLKDESKSFPRQYWEAVQLARSMANDKAAGNQASYENKLFKFAVTYADIFTAVEPPLDYDRIELLDTLAEILPDYFSSSFSKYGRFIS